MYQYLGDHDSVFNSVLKENPELAAYYDSLPGVLREKVRASGLYDPQAIGARIDELISDGN